MHNAIAQAPGCCLPTLFVSHGSPMIALEPREAGQAMRAMGAAIERLWGRPKAIVVMSPHTVTGATRVLSSARHAAVHDFGGFPPALYDLRYDAPGDPALAQRVADALHTADAHAQAVSHAGLDHGVWTTLMYLYPQADVPVIPVSMTPAATPGSVMRLGQALHGLVQAGVLVIGSGSLTHNLRRFFTQPLPADAPESPDCAAFRAWVDSTTQVGDWPALLAYRDRAPHAVEMHPSDEHWLPFYFAAGAAMATGTVPTDTHTGTLTGPLAQRLHASVTHGHLAMDAYGFGPGAQPLRQALMAI